MTATGPDDTPRDDPRTTDSDIRHDGRTQPEQPQTGDIDRRSAAAEPVDPAPRHSAAPVAEAGTEREDAPTRRIDTAGDHDAVPVPTGAHAVPAGVEAGARHDGAGAARRHDREAVVAREHERFGGVKVGSAFFGWLSATGALVLLTALAAGIAALVASFSGGIDDAVDEAQRDLASAGLWGVVILLVIWFVAYYAGGYVAGRMARFDGAKQGAAVWVWAVAIAILAALVGIATGQNFAVPPGSMPVLPLPEEQAAIAAIIGALVVALVALVGAVLGGMAGMHFHRRVDRAGFDLAAVEPQ